MDVSTSEQSRIARQRALALPHPPVQSRYTENVPRDTAPPVTLLPDPVIEAYKKDIDRTLLRETLKVTPSQRLQRLQDFLLEEQRRSEPKAND